MLIAFLALIIVYVNPIRTEVFEAEPEERKSTLNEHNARQ